MRSIKKVILREKEEEKYLTIKKVSENSLSKERASVKLNCSIRQINRLIKGYQEFGKSFFIHGNRGKKPSTAIPAELQNKIVHLFKNIYYDFNFAHFHEKLEKKEGIYCSYPTVVSLLYSRGIISPKSHKVTKKRIKESLKKCANPDVILPKTEVELAVESQKAHPRMSRSKYFGELIQMDASVEFWFGNTKTQLHIAIDDATGMIVGGYFDYQETLHAYYQVTSQILKKYGIPAKFLTDNRTVFDYKKSGDTSIENDYSTQFGYSCSQLGIALETSSVPQAKGRVERVFGTLQSRLKAELRLLNVLEIKVANDFLVEYIAEFNKEFAIEPNSIKSVFDSKVNDEEINVYLSVIHERIVDRGHSIKFNNQYYFLLDNAGNHYYLKPKTKVAILKALDGTLFGLVGGVTHNLLAIESHERISKEFDLEEVEKPVTKKYIPPKTHPWKAASFNSYLEKNNQEKRILEDSTY